MKKTPPERIEEADLVIAIARGKISVVKDRYGQPRALTFERAVRLVLKTVDDSKTRVPRTRRGLAR